jgi:copper chaperone CopZ
MQRDLKVSASSIILTIGLIFGGVAIACPGVENCNQEACSNIQPPPPMSDSLEGNTMNFTVNGLRCGNCSAKVMNKLNEINGVAGSQVDHSTGTGSVVFNADLTSAEALIAAVTELGYSAAIVAPE